MARRVGFGDRSRERASPDADDDTPTDGPIALDAAAEGKKNAGPVARLFIITFLLAWLALWSFGIYEAWSSVTDLWANFDWDAFDIVMLAFFAVWLGGALIGWAFGVVILFVMLFGKEAENSPAERAERLKLRLRRRNSGKE